MAIKMAVFEMVENVNSYTKSFALIAAHPQT